MEGSHRRQGLHNRRVPTGEKVPPGGGLAYSREIHTVGGYIPSIKGIAMQPLNCHITQKGGGGEEITQLLSLLPFALLPIPPIGQTQTETREQKPGDTGHTSQSRE